MGKPSAPAAPDYTAAAQAQGTANVNSAVASNRLNQVNQVGPNGSLTYSYSTPDSGQGYTDPQTGQYIPQVTTTTSLSPEQQKLYDQNTNISTSLNDLAQKGIGYVADASSKPIDQSTLPSLATGLGVTNSSVLGQSGDTSLSSGDQNAVALRDKITNAMMARLQPYMDQQKQQLAAQNANQGITLGSQADNFDQYNLNKSQNDQRIAALLAGDTEQSNLFNQGLANSQFQNAARQQAIQEADYFKNQPLNMLNALRSGNQVSMPQFGNVSGGAQVQAAPVYQAANDQYSAALKQYQTEMAGYTGALSGLGQIGSAAVTGGFKASDRRLKTNIKLLGIRPDGLGVYSYDYIWGGSDIGVMADEVAIFKPEALGPTIGGFATVNYGAL